MPWKCNGFLTTSAQSQYRRNIERKEKFAKEQPSVAGLRTAKAISTKAED